MLLLLAFIITFKGLRNCVLRIIREWLLFCSIRALACLRFLVILLKN